MRPYVMQGMCCLLLGCWAAVATAAALPSEVSYSSYLGGDDMDFVSASCADSQGNVYVVGHTTSTNLPVPNAYDSTYNGGNDGFLIKLNPQGQVLYGTYFGGTSDDAISSIAIGDNGHWYICGSTYSTLTVTANALDTSLSGGRDAFVAEFDENGTLAYCTYLGGNNWDYGNVLALETESGSVKVYVAGSTEGNFPVTTGAAQETFGGFSDGFVAKLSWTALSSTLEYSTYVGGKYYDSVWAIKVRNGQVYIGNGSQSPDYPVTTNALDAVNDVPAENQGGDGTFTILSADGKSFVYSTFIGPEDSPKETYFNAIGISDDGNTIVLAGATNEPNFSVTSDALQSSLAGKQDAVLVRLVKSGTDYQVVYSTFLGGSENDQVTSALMLDGKIWLVGESESSGFPLGTTDYGGKDVFVAALDSSGVMVWKGRYGGSLDDWGGSLSISPNQTRLRVMGRTAASDFLTSGDATQKIYGGGSTDGYRLDLIVASEPTPTPTVTPRVIPSPSVTAVAPLRSFGTAYPNPFVPTRGQITEISLPPEVTASTIRILNMRGRLVRTLRDEVRWDGRDDQGRMCESGVYLFQVDASGMRKNGKVVLIK